MNSQSTSIRVPAGFEKLPNDGGLPRYQHLQSRSVWRHHPGGHVSVGATELEKALFLNKADSEIAHQDRMELIAKTTIQNLQIKPFLIMEAPVAWEMVEDLFGAFENYPERPMAESGRFAEELQCYGHGRMWGNGCGVYPG